MSIIVSIGTTLPKYKINQTDIYSFMNELYGGTEDDNRRLKTMYDRSAIHTRYSVLSDYDANLNKRTLFPDTKNLEPFPSLEMRMQKYHEHAPRLAIGAIKNCLQNKVDVKNITHLITVSCTGLSAPGLDLDIMEQLQLPKNIYRTSVNFMGCYAAIHAMKIADAICKNEPDAIVVIVCVELCTLHFQKKFDQDNITANAIFGDGASAMLICSDEYKKSKNTLSIEGFYSEVHTDAKRDMAWQLSSTGFLMTLSSYIPQLVESNIENLLTNALYEFGIGRDDISAWAIHPGGRKILEAIEKQLLLKKASLKYSYDVLRDFGNMSSVTILFVLKYMMEDEEVKGNIFGAGFGPGLTMETFLLNK